MAHEFDTILEAVPSLRLLVAVLSLQRPGFNPRPVRMGFMVDIVAMGQVLLLVLQFSPASIPPTLYAHSFLTYAVES